MGHCLVCGFFMPLLLAIALLSSLSLFIKLEGSAAMSHNSQKVPEHGQDADSLVAHPSAPSMNPEPSQANSNEEPDEEIHEEDSAETPERPAKSETDAAHGTTDAGISTAHDEEGRVAFDRVSRLLLQGEDADEEALAAIAQIGREWPEQLDRAITDDGYTVLHIAVENNLPKAFSALLEARKSLANSTNNWRSALPLHIACLRGRIDFVKKLVRLESNTDAQDALLMTPLNYACFIGDVGIVEFLLDRRVDISLANDYGWTPLTTAVQKGHKSVAERVLDKGANINHADNRGRTPLHYATRGDDSLDLMSFLIGRDADINTRNGDGFTPLHIACWSGYEEIVRLLTVDFRDRVDIESRDQKGLTPLMTASRAGFPEIVRLLLDAGADCTACSTEESRRVTALMDACCRGHDEIARMLLLQPPGKAGELLNQEDTDGDTPLHYAILFGQSHIVNILLKWNADHSKQNGDGCTPLHIACLNHFHSSAASDEKRSQTESETVSQSSTTDEISDPCLCIAESLLEKGANPSTKTDQDETALHLVAKRQNSLFIAKIMKHMKPEDYSLKNKAEKTALHIAVEREDSSVVLALLQRLGSPECDFANKEKEACALAFKMLDSEEIRKTLVEFFRTLKPPNVRESRKDWGVLEWVAVEGHPSMLWEILAKSPRTNQTNVEIQRALKKLESEKSPEGSPGADLSKYVGNIADREKKASKGARKNAEAKVAIENEFNQKQYIQGPIKKRHGNQDNDRESNRKLIKDILMNPPIVTTSMPWEKLRLPIKPTNPRVPREMEAVLLEFFVSGKTSGFLRRAERVEDVVYTKGPERIMYELKDRLRGIKERSKLPVGDFQQELLGTLPEPMFTWIHLPANNVSAAFFSWGRIVEINSRRVSLTEAKQLKWMNVRNCICFSSA